MLYDIKYNRASRKWSRKQNLVRFLWAILKPLFRMSPRTFWWFRNALLRFFGAKIGKNCRIHPSVEIEIPWNLQLSDNVGVGHKVVLYALGKINIGADCTISQFAHLCAGTHDYNSKGFDLIKSEIEIGDRSWVGSNAFVGPDVHIASDVIIGACAVVFSNVNEGAVVVGNPGKVIKIRPNVNV